MAILVFFARRGAFVLGRSNARKPSFAQIILKAALRSRLAAPGTGALRDLTSLRGFEIPARFVALGVELGQGWGAGANCGQSQRLIGFRHRLGHDAVSAID